MKWWSFNFSSTYLFWISPLHIGYKNYPSWSRILFALSSLFLGSTGIQCSNEIAHFFNRSHFRSNYNLRIDSAIVLHDSFRSSASLRLRIERCKSPSRKSRLHERFSVIDDQTLLVRRDRGVRYIDMAARTRHTILAEITFFSFSLVLVFAKRARFIKHVRA